MNFTNPVFKIRNLKCQYVVGKTVLSIDELDLPSGALIFLLGASGVGKSTFIETLGLMNKTIAVDDATSIQFSSENQTDIELKNSWSKSDEELSAFRNDYFSFIFQNTNLMPNFTAGENMCISRLIKGASMDEVKTEVLQVMESLDLDANIFDKKVTELSGGQRQRLAFVRAIISEFTVLFGDEPTGNLDKKTAHKLMEILKSYLANKTKTGIIVSHDIDLALKFADVIVLLTHQKQGDPDSGGKIIPQNILVNNNNKWKDINQQKIENIEDFIDGIFEVKKKALNTIHMAKYE